MGKVIAFCDGGCEPNPGAGGWGVVLEFHEDGRMKHRKELYGGESDTTNNRMEITAAIMALRALKRPCEVTLYSDSQYLIKTMTENWSRGKNSDLWQQLEDLLHKDFFNEQGHKVDWQWVRGHMGNMGNERAHVLSMMGVEQARRSA